MTNRWLRITAATLIAGLILGGFAVAQTANEILDRMDEEAERMLGDGMIVVLGIHNESDDKTSTDRKMGILQAPNKSLSYFIEPWDWEGSIILSVTAQDEEGKTKTRIWFYVPLVYPEGKELINEEERSQGFADSAMSMERMAEEDTRNDDYDSTLIGQETLTIGDQERTAYVIESIAIPDADVDETRSVMWVDAEAYVMLKVEGYNELGVRTTTMNVLELGEFEGTLVTDVIHVDSRTAGVISTYTILEQRRVEGGFPEGVFDSANLPAFDPSEWGF